MKDYAYGQIVFDENGKKKIEYFEEDFRTPFLTEVVSKEQKEKAQRIMNQTYIEPFKRLRLYLLEKWSHPKTKNEYLKRNEEFAAFNKLAKILKKTKYKHENPANIIYKSVLKTSSKRVHVFNSYGGIGTQVRELEGEKVPYLLIDPQFRISKNVNGFKFNSSDDEIREIVNKFILSHELGHIYEYLKDLVENGRTELVDTYREQDRNKVTNSESKANSYAIDNMYRKDRRELLKDGKPGNSEREKEYTDKISKYSKTYNKTLKSIQKENSHFGY